MSGPGGVGKGTLVFHLCARRPELWLSRSWTTRPRRPGEAADGYTFVDRPRFLTRAAEGGFLEWTENAANHELYGTPWPDPPPGDDVVLEIDLTGASRVLERHPEAVVILVVAPSEQEQAARMRKRGDSEDHIAGRLALGRQEEVRGRALATHVVVNDDLDRAVDELAGIVEGYREPPAPAS